MLLRKKKDKPTKVVAASSSMMSSEGSRDLFGQTLRTVAILVGSCVLFVGALSAAAVAITSKAMGASPNTAVEMRDPSQSPQPKKPVSI